MDSDWDASIPEHRAAAIRYWHHAYDEWYVTNRLDDKLLKSLWEQYYSKAVLGGLNHYGLRKTLIGMKKTNGYRAELWKDYFEELDVIWAKNHPPDGKKCAGIECVHNRSEESYELARR
jgi:hypothetical protein